MTKQDVRIKITFVPDGHAELEVSTPIHSHAGFRMWAALAGLRINPMSAYLVRSATRLIANVKLTEYDGSPIAQHRAGQVLNVLKERLCGPNERCGAKGPGPAASTPFSAWLGACRDADPEHERRSA
jgi:hypothetical protein